MTWSSTGRPAGRARGPRHPHAVLWALSTETALTLLALVSRVITRPLHERAVAYKV